jgi:hypothetical protein
MNCHNPHEFIAQEQNVAQEFDQRHPKVGPMQSPAFERITALLFRCLHLLQLLHCGDRTLFAMRQPTTRACRVNRLMCWYDIHPLGSNCGT